MKRVKCSLLTFIEKAEVLSDLVDELGSSGIHEIEVDILAVRFLAFNLPMVSRSSQKSQNLSEDYLLWFRLVVDFQSRLRGWKNSQQVIEIVEIHGILVDFIMFILFHNSLQENRPIFVNQFKEAWAEGKFKGGSLQIAELLQFDFVCESEFNDLYVSLQELLPWIRSQFHLLGSPIVPEVVPVDNEFFEAWVSCIYWNGFIRVLSEEEHHIPLVDILLFAALSNQGLVVEGEIQRFLDEFFDEGLVVGSEVLAEQSVLLARNDVVLNDGNDQLVEITKVFEEVET